MDITKEERIFTTMPDGWTEIKGAMTAPVGYIWICNNKSRFSGEYEQALLKIREEDEK